MNENEQHLIEAMAENPDFIKQLWALIEGFVKHTTINDGYLARAGYEALPVIEAILRPAGEKVTPVKKEETLRQFEEKECLRCRSTFRTNNGSDLCYNCTLKDITHGNPPGEGDFNTAGIVSGTLSAQERSYLQQDLESVELGRTTGEEYGYEEEEEDYPEDDERDDWEYDEREDAKWGHEG